MRRESRRAGFTLLEIVLAFTLLAFMMVMVSTIVSSAVQANHQIETMLQETEAAPAILNVMRMDIEAAFSPDSSKPYFYGVEKNGGAGPMDELDFVASRMSYGSEEIGAEPQFHPINEVGYRLEENKTDRAFLMLTRREEHFFDAEPARGGIQVELYDKVKSLMFEYWNGKQWARNWDSRRERGRVPEAVRVTMGLAVRAGGEVTTHAIVVLLAPGY